jgi:hypothetical protein
MTRHLPLTAAFLIGLAVLPASVLPAAAEQDPATLLCSDMLNMDENSLEMIVRSVMKETTGADTFDPDMARKIQRICNQKPEITVLAAATTPE